MRKSHAISRTNLSLAKVVLSSVGRQPKSQINQMEGDSKYFLTTLFLKETILKVVFTDKAEECPPRESCTRVSLCTTRWKARAFSSGLMGVFTMEVSKLARRVAVAYTCGLMDSIMKAISLMTSATEVVFSSTQMARNSMEFGKTVKSMETGSIFGQTSQFT